jgi:Methane oxygenase PmoA
VVPVGSRRAQPADSTACGLRTSRRTSDSNQGAGGTHPAHWFVRNGPFAAVAPSWSFFEELEPAPGDTLRRRYRVVVADGARQRADVVAYLEAHPW